MSSGRVHVGTTCAGADVHLIASWTDGTPIADIEEAIKAAARTAVRDARERTKQQQ